MSDDPQNPDVDPELVHVDKFTWGPDDGLVIESLPDEGEGE